MRPSALLAPLLLASACMPCAGISTHTPELCALRDGGLGATVYVGNESGSATCTAGHDGGMAVFAMEGQRCAMGSQNLPVAFPVTAPCDVSALPAGSYVATVAGEGQVTLALPLTPDSGLRACP